MFWFKYQAVLLSLAGLITATPNASDWDTLNHTVSGRLYSAAPLSLPCFSAYNGLPSIPDPSLCSQIQANYTSSDFRAQFYNGFMNNQDEMCASNATDQCILDYTNPTNPEPFEGNKSCNQGSVSLFYIEIAGVEDVQAAFAFSRKTGVMLSIKNSGHDYLGRCSLKGSLALWMRKVGGMKRERSFVPEGCYGVAAIDTITTAAGVNLEEVYGFAEEQNVTFVGGYASTIGAAGGWAQGGGHSVLSPVYGLGIDRTVQFKVVTTDGVLRIANACQNSDLFWALKGGGGGTFGVVMEATHLVDPVVPLSVAYIKYNQTATNIGQWLEVLVNNGLAWAKQGWGGHYVASNIIAITPLLNISEATISMAPAEAFARANNGSIVIETLPSWYSFYTKYVVPNEAPVGAARLLAARLISTSLFESASGRAKLLSFLNHLVSLGISPYIPATAPYLFPYVANSTSATPAWRSSIWELGFVSSWAENSTVPQRQATVQLSMNLTAMSEELTPGGGAYVNEALPWTEDWQEAWWGGENYARLLQIKKKYDPDGLLSCWKCVGFDEETASEKYPCYTAYGS